MMQGYQEDARQYLTRANSVCVAIAKDSGFDGLAAGLALFLSLKKLGKNPSIIGPAPRVTDAQNLYAVDKIGTQSEKNNLVVVIDNAVEKVDKVTYLLDGNKLKIVVHALAGAQGARSQDISFENTTAAPDLIIAIGFTSADQLKREITHEQNITSNIPTISLNISTLNHKFAHIDIGDNQATSICQLAASFIRELALPIDEDIAFNLYNGLAHATFMFSPALTTPSTFELALFLIDAGAGKASLATKPPKVDLDPNFDRGLLNQPLVTKASQVKKISSQAFGKTNQQYSESARGDKDQKAIEEVEEEPDKESWLKPPKIYRGSKSFDRES